MKNKIKQKKAISIFLAIVMLASVTFTNAVAVFASTYELEISVSPAQTVVSAGDVVDIAIVVDVNSKGISMLHLDITWDYEVLQPVFIGSSSNVVNDNNESMPWTLQPTSIDFQNNEGARMIFAASGFPDGANWNSTGPLATISVRVLEDAVLGPHTLTIENVVAARGNLPNVMPIPDGQINLNNGELTVTQALVIPTSVTITGPANVQTGTTAQFGAIVGPTGASQTVTWSVNGHASATINESSGLLSTVDVPANTQLTITAIAANTNVSNTATVNVTAAPPQQPDPPVETPADPGDDTTPPPALAPTPAVPAPTEAGDDLPPPPVMAAPGFIFGDATHLLFILGEPDGNFHPNRSVSRAEVAAIGSRIHFTDIGQNNADFPDVASHQWFYNYVGFMQQGGLLLGRPDGSFAPTDNMTRAEFVTMITRFVGLTANGTSEQFADATNHWASGYINALLTEMPGTILGFEDGTFRPDALITRAEVVTIINRILDRSIDGSALENVSYGSFADIEGHWAYYEIISASNNHNIEVFGGIILWTSASQDIWWN